MYVKSSPSQQGAVVESWTTDFLVLGQAVYHRAILPTSVGRVLQNRAYSLWFASSWDARLRVLDVNPLGCMYPCLGTTGLDKVGEDLEDFRYFSWFAFSYDAWLHVLEVDPMGCMYPSLKTTGLDKPCEGV